MKLLNNKILKNTNNRQELVRKSNLSNLNLSNSNFPKRYITNKDQYSEAKVFSQEETITRRKIRKEIKNMYRKLKMIEQSPSAKDLENVEHIVGESIDFREEKLSGKNLRLDSEKLNQMVEELVNINPGVDRRTKMLELFSKNLKSNSKQL